ncbi:MAG: GNAT family N-acetyltransferase [Tepidiformaceae bacterium]
MRVLGAGDYGSVRPLVAANREAGHMAFVHAVLDGSMPGSVAVDDAGSPRSAVVVAHSGFAFAIGQARGDLFAPFLPQWLATCLSDEPTALWATTHEWEEHLGPLFAERDFRNEYHCVAATGAGPATRPLRPGFELRPIDLELARDGFEGRVDPWVVRIWGGPEAFMERAFGTAVVRDGVLASFCTVCAMGGPSGAVEAEIEIGTAADSRRLGLAEHAGRAFIAETRARRLLPAWTCRSSNAASAGLAERLGFVYFRRVTGYPVHPQMAQRHGRWVLPDDAQRQPG